MILATIDDRRNGLKALILDGSAAGDMAGVRVLPALTDEMGSCGWEINHLPTTLPSTPRQTLSMLRSWNSWSINIFLGRVLCDLKGGETLCH